MLAGGKGARMETNELSKLISLTFDENPEVRKNAAASLGAIDDPAAIFALMELTYDKEPTVREASIKILDKRKQSEADVMSFAEIFATRAKQKGADATPTEGTQVQNDAKDKVLQPITRIFEKHWGKEKAETVRSKMMPAIEKMYMKNRAVNQTQTTASVSETKGGGSVDPAEIFLENDENGRKVMQEFLTSYLEVISELDHVGSGPTPGQASRATLTVHEDTGEEKEERVEKPEKHARVTGHGRASPSPVETTVAAPVQLTLAQPAVQERESAAIPYMEIDEMTDLRNEKGISELPGTFFRKAYELMMLSGGDESVMKREMDSMMEDAIKEIGLAFKLAKKRFKEAKITNLTKIKDGMRNVNTDLLAIKKLEVLETKNEKKQKISYHRIVVQDSAENEGILYLFDEKGSTLRPGMRIKLVAGGAKTYAFSGETVLITGKKGNVYIVL